MIVRISTEDQYRIPDEDAAKLNELDNAVVAAVEAGDEDKYHELFEELLNYVRTQGEAVADDDLVESDVILPPPDTSFVDAAEDFTGEGLIPD